MARKEYTALGYSATGEDGFALPRLSARNLCDILGVEGFESHSFMDDAQPFCWFDVRGAHSAFRMPVENSRVLHIRNPIVNDIAKKTAFPL